MAKNIFIYTLLVFFISNIPQSALSWDKWDRRQESISVYVCGGPAFPIGSHAENKGYKTGYQFGGGIGAVVYKGVSGSLVLALKANYYEFNESRPYRASWGNITIENEDTDISVNIEGIYKFILKSEVKPYLLFGGGYYSNEILLTAGFGIDQIVAFNKISGIYSELRFLSSFLHQIRFDVGIRIGL